MQVGLPAVHHEAMAQLADPCVAMFSTSGRRTKAMGQIPRWRTEGEKRLERLQRSPIPDGISKIAMVLRNGKRPGVRTFIPGLLSREEAEARSVKLDRRLL